MLTIHIFISWTQKASNECAPVSLELEDTAGCIQGEQNPVSGLLCALEDYYVCR